MVVRLSFSGLGYLTLLQIFKETQKGKDLRTNNKNDYTYIITFSNYISVCNDAGNL